MSKHARAGGPQQVDTATRPTDETVSDQRLLRGARARHRIARHAVDVASLEGLEGLSIGRLATDLGLSKSGIQTLFRTKEKLQLAAAETAREEFIEAVVRPAQAAPPGAPRLWALTEHWLAYAQTPLFAGGCFWAAVLPDFDGRPGVVRDALVRHRSAWLALLTDEVRHAVATEQAAEVDPDLVAFQVDAVLMSANTAMRLGDVDAASKVRRVVKGLLGAPAASIETPKE